MANNPARPVRLDLATLFGILLALAALIGGLFLEGGALPDVLQHTAALIVVGGTLGATLISTPLTTVLGAGRALRSLWLHPRNSLAAEIEQLVVYSTQARRNGLVSLETEVLEMKDPFLRTALGLAIDGCDFAETRKIMELEIDQYAQHHEQYVKVFEAAGGYCPTIGILGAVMGLIQVMKKLDNIEEVGHGIAVAFVATLYGVGLANLVFLPAAAKIKARLHDEILRRELLLEGVLAIIEGLNPQMLRIKLGVFLQDVPASAATKKPREPGRRAA